MSNLIFRVRLETGAHLQAAHTVTVSEANLVSIGEILGWLIAERRRLDAFRMASFQAEANVGRTRLSKKATLGTEVWNKVCEALDSRIPRDTLWFGHPDCGSMISLLVLYPERRVINLIPSDAHTREFVSAMLNTFGGIGSRGSDTAEANLRRVAIALRNPGFVFKALRYAIARLLQERLCPGLALRTLRNRAAPPEHRPP